jgi:hypothetical protein
MEDGGTAAVLYERIVRGVGRLHTPKDTPARSCVVLFVGRQSLTYLYALPLFALQDCR